MQFDPSYFTEETREGFYIPTMVKRCWAAQLEVFEQVRMVCDRHNLRWFADYGTMIGAVRHKGYIPWDDDFDICMFRDDYEKFKIAARQELPEGYLVFDRDNVEDYDNFLLRVVNTSVISIENKHLAANHGFPYSAGIDIFPLDYLYEDDEKEKDRQNKLNTLWEIAEKIRVLDNDAEIADYKDTIESIAGYSLDPSYSVYNGLLRIMDKIFSECDGNNSTKCAYMRFYMTDNSHIYLLDYYKEYITVPFEITDIRVPVGYSEILKHNYGDWYKVYRTGAAHDYPLFKKMENALYEKGHYIPYRYFYRPEDSMCTGRIEHWANSNINNNIVKTLGDVVELIISTIEAGNMQSAAELLVQAQELAINLGNSIEEQYGEVSNVIGILEKYCERIYSLYEKLQAGENINTYQEQKRFLKVTDNLIRTYKSDIPRKKNVIFMPAVPANWKYMSDYYNELANDDNNIVRIMPIPYADRADDGSLIGDYVAHIDDYPKELSIIDYQKYDFEHNHPDIIVIQEGWDEFSSGRIVHPFFYSTNIYKYTDHLTFIPPYQLDEFERTDEKSFNNLMYTAIKPGVICSDEFVLYSEKIKEYCVEWLVAGTDIKDSSYWNNKITVIDTMTDDKIFSSQNSEKKILLFYISCSDIYIYQEKAIKKMISILDEFITARDRLAVIWYTEEDYLENLKRIATKIYDHYLEQVKRFSVSQLGIQICTDELKDALHSADAYYGSAGYIQNQCVYHKKPSMIITWDNDLMS